MKSLLSLISAIYTCLLLAAPLQAAPKATAPLQTQSISETSATPITVVELFTSQGCYSCPPADELLGQLKQQENTIVMACHVSYWNYLGWQDTFSKSFCDTRQRRYQQFLQGRAGVYTPQMVVNGRYGVVGSRKHRVAQAINLGQKRQPPIAISLSQQQQQLTIELPSLDNQTGSHQLLLMGISGHHRLPIVRGENGGKTLDYYNPVITVVPLGQWQGEAKTLTQILNPSGAVEEWVLLAQSTRNNHIVAAGKVAAAAF